MAIVTQTATLATIPGARSIAADKVGTASAPATGDEIQYVKLDLGAAGASSPASGTVPVSDNAGSLTVDAPVATPVFVRLSDGTAAIATLPVSLATAPSTPVTNAGTFAAQATLAAETTKIIGTINVAAAQTLATVTAVTAITNALPTGTNTLGAVTGPAAAPLALDASLTNGNQVAQLRSSTLIVTGTAAAGTGVTVTLPAVAGQFHYITRINIVKYASVATVGAAAPTVVTSTNLPGSVAWTLPTALAVGTQYETDVEPAGPVKSSVVNTATTVVAAALASIIYRITVYYYTAA